METKAIYRRMQAILPEGKWIEDLWSIEPTIFAVLGENLIHVKGFYPELVSVARAYGDSTIYLLDTEVEQRVIEFDLADTEVQYMAKQRNAPEIGPGWGFPFGLCRQAFVGDGAWVLLSDRDAERMCFMTRKLLSTEQLAAVWQMLRLP